MADTPAAPDLKLVIEGPIAWIVASNPERMNALTAGMWARIPEHVRAAEADPAVRVLVLRGEGTRAFSAGADISEFPAVRATPEQGRAYEHAGDHCQTAIASCSKPTIAAISGPCYGGGVGVALSCDFRVADATSYFAIPAARLSNVYGVVETRALFDAVGYAAAKEVLFTGRRYDAPEAHRIGLATHMADGPALAAAHALAASMRKCAPLTIKGAKVVLGAIAHAETVARQGDIARVADEAMASEDYKEGVAAFAAKRDPVFRGR